MVEIIQKRLSLYDLSEKLVRLQLDSPLSILYIPGICTLHPCDAMLLDRLQLMHLSIDVSLQIKLCENHISRLHDFCLFFFLTRYINTIVIIAPVPHS